MKINRIKRLYEEDLMQMQATAPVQTPQPVQQMPQMQQMQAPMPAQIEMPMDMEEPSGMPEMGSQSEVSQMTVGDFLQKCKALDPLVCMGIEAFIEKNKDMFTLASSDAQIDAELKDVEFGSQEDENDLPEIEFPVDQQEQM
jgi:hypothetical protein